MTIRQIYYTSCRRGADGIEGFQVHAATPGVDDEAARVGVQLGLYRPGPASPPMPTGDQLRSFPVALGYRRSGTHAVLSHSRYLGADFTGRQGNYFAHILVLDAPERDLAGALPVDTWEGEGWSWQQVDDLRLPPLPRLPCGPLESFSTGAHLRDGRLPQFAGVLAAVVGVLAKGSGRVVVVADDTVDMAAVVAAVTHSLPRPLATQVTFLTYSADPDRAGVVLAGTRPDVTLPADPFGERTLVRLDGPPSAAGAVGTRYAAVLEALWRAGDAGAAAVRLAAGLDPPLAATELDGFAELAMLVTSSGGGPDAGLDVLAALDVGLRRAPAALTPEVWDRAARQVADDGIAPERAAAWSGVLERAYAARFPVPPAVQRAYLWAFLSASLTGDTGPAWLPDMREPHLVQTVLGWASDAIRADPAVDTAATVLHAVERTRIGMPDELLREIADRVVRPALLDPATAPRTAVELARMPAATRLLPAVVDAVEQQVRGTEFAAVARVLPADAAERLAPHAPRGSRASVVFAIAMVRGGVGEHSAIAVFRDALRSVGTTAHSVDGLVDLLWPTGLTVGELAAVAAVVPAEVLAGTAVPSEVERLLESAAADGPLTDVHLDLVDRLDGGRAGGAVFRAVALAARFEPQARDGGRAADQAGEAVRLSAELGPALRRWVLGRIVERSLRQPGPQIAAIIGPVLRDGSTPEFVGAFRDGIVTALRTGPPDRIAHVLPALANLAARHKRVRDCLDTSAALVLTGRRKRDLDAVTKAIGKADRSLRPLLKDMGRSAPKSWPIWWETWRVDHIRTSLFGRLMARLRVSKVAG